MWRQPGNSRPIVGGAIPPEAARRSAGMSRQAFRSSTGRRAAAESAWLALYLLTPRCRAAVQNRSLSEHVLLAPTDGDIQDTAQPLECARGWSSGADILHSFLCVGSDPQRADGRQTRPDLGVPPTFGPKVSIDELLRVTARRTLREAAKRLIEAEDGCLSATRPCSFLRVAGGCR